MFTSSTFIGILYGQMVRHVLHDHGELPLVLLHAGHLLGVKVWSGGAGAEDNLKWVLYFIYLVFWQKGPVIAFNEKFNFIQILWSVVDSDFPLMHSLRRANWFISKRLANNPPSTPQYRLGFRVVSCSGHITLVPWFARLMKFRLFCLYSFYLSQHCSYPSASACSGPFCFII